MKDSRYKEIMNNLGQPESRSLLMALEQVANEVAQEVHASYAEDRVSLLQYKSLRENFQKMITEVLGAGYYNMGMDVYECDRLSCEDITNKTKGFFRKLFG